MASRAFIVFSLAAILLSGHAFLAPECCRAAPRIAIDVTPMRDSLSALKNEYDGLVSAITFKNLMSNELLVGREIQGTLQDWELLETTNLLLERYYAVNTPDDHREIWKEVVDSTNGILHVVHLNMEASSLLVNISLKQENRCKAIATRYLEILAQAQKSLPRKIQ